MRQAIFSEHTPLLALDFSASCVYRPREVGKVNAHRQSDTGALLFQLEHPKKRLQHQLSGLSGSTILYILHLVKYNLHIRFFAFASPGFCYKCN